MMTTFQLKSDFEANDDIAAEIAAAKIDELIIALTEERDELIKRADYDRIQKLTMK